DHMSAVVLDSYTGVNALRIERRPVPQPGPNEVLVKVAATTINPSDLAFLEGLYGFKKPVPVVPGFEGSGMVVAVGRGMLGKYLHGKRVACISQEQGSGVWAEYLVTAASLAFPLDASVNLEQGAMSVTNPLTAMAFLTLAKEGRHNAIVQTGAASALGQMVNRLCKSEGIQIINIVRRDAQKELLQEQGAEIVLNSSDADFPKHLWDICQQYQSRLAFDAVAGPLTIQLLKAMPSHSKVIVFGGLSYEPARVEPGQLIFEGKSIEGFWLPMWMSKKNFLQSLVFWQRAQKLMMTDLKSEIRRQYPLDEVQNAIRDYQSQMTGGKILLRPAP
ncbi:MAG TPA: zinc-binding dehydrogenase, partial [Nitrosomonas sp.]|nr:zinc-binding dehydrogenase [Nitrosomonas sp.]